MRLLLFTALLGSAISLAIRKAPHQELEEYSDEFTRYKMFSFAAAAYSDDPNGCLKSAYPHEGNDTATRVVEAICVENKNATCKGFTAVSHSDKAIIVAFGGTEVFVKLVDDIRRDLHRTPPKADMIPIIAKAEKFSAGGYVSSYFYAAFKALWDAGVKEDFLALKSADPDYEVWVTGHSLGGAMASLAATVLAHESLVESDKLKLVTFGQPRTGDFVFATIHDHLIDYSYRITHWEDEAVHYPPAFYPAGFLRGYIHHKAEIFYDEVNNYLVCHEPVDMDCSAGNLWPKLHGHLYYFQSKLTVMEYGQQGCPTNLLAKTERIDHF
ncbi:hypothetical protein QR680_015109 [Steinernema hermaphroditum]|uniref:Fungal lipase-type domain-containing protein n=1 Tax=Steinernema hermaphroditum TaxID=289476 RepID=A0AA39M569_9BILA|nr:hypothetical protein QR680_015109 [Steinernema hermaphroditum]